MTFSLCGELRRGDRSAAYTFGVLSGGDRSGRALGVRAGGARVLAEAADIYRSMSAGEYRRPAFRAWNCPTARTPISGTSRNGFRRRDFREIP